MSETPEPTSVFLGVLVAMLLATLMFAIGSVAEWRARYTEHMKIHETVKP